MNGLNIEADITRDDLLGEAVRRQFASLGKVRKVTITRLRHTPSEAVATVEMENEQEAKQVAKKIGITAYGTVLTLRLR